MAWCEGDDQRQPVAVDQRVGLGRQPAARTSDRVVIRFDDAIRRFLVTRPSPLCGNWARPGTSQQSRRAGELARRSSRPRRANRSRHEHRPGPATRSGPCPRSRRSRTDDDASTPSATARTPKEDHARQHLCGSDRSLPRPEGGDHASAGPSHPSRAGGPPRSGPTSHRSALPAASCAQHQAPTTLNIGDTP